MSRRVDTNAAACVDSLLPSLGALSVNASAKATSPPDIALSRETMLLLEDGYAIEAAGDKRKIGEEVVDPKDGKPASWLIPKKDAQGNDVFDEEGKQVYEFNIGLHKRLMWQENSAWRLWYPPPPPVKEPEKYPYDSGWTRFYPGGRNLKITNPHWLRSGWASKRHETLAEARKAFAITLQQMLKPHTDKDAALRAEKDAQQKRDMDEFQKILNDDGDKLDNSKESPLKASLFRMRALLADRTPLSNRSSVPFPLPPGWLPIKKRRTPETLAKNAKAGQKVGKYADVSYVGTQWSQWKAGESLDESSLHNAYEDKRVVQAWLIYLNYQTAGSTYDQGELSKMGVQGFKEAHEENLQIIEEQRKNADQVRESKKAKNEASARARGEETAQQREDAQRDQEDLQRMKASLQNDAADDPLPTAPGASERPVATADDLLEMLKSDDEDEYE